MVLTDKALHTRMKKNAYNAYSMGSMLQLEPLVDAVTDRFFKILDDVVETPSRTCDLGKWLRYYATDVIFAVTFGEDLQFMEKGDPIGMMPMLEYIAGDYVSIVKQTPPQYDYLNILQMHLLTHFIRLVNFHGFTNSCLVIDSFPN